MNADDIIHLIQTSEKQTPVKAYIREKRSIDYDNMRVFGAGDKIVFADWKILKPFLEAHSQDIEDVYIECDRANSALELLDIKNLRARVEPGAIIRGMASIGERAVIMMGAIINIGAQVGEDTMIDMGAVLGGRAIVGKRCHIGAGAVLAGVVEPASATPVIIEDDVLIGANAVIIEGVRVGTGAVVAAGAVVTRDVNPNEVVAGVPARVIKTKDAQTQAKTALVEALREM